MKDVVYQLALNNSPEIIVRAAEIVAGEWNVAFKSMNLELYKSKFTAEQFTEHWLTDTRSVIWECPIISVNPMRLSDPFLVRYPNGTTGWEHGKRTNCYLKQPNEF